MYNRSLIFAILLMAQPLHAEIVITNSATVHGSASASASTGGNEVDAGGIVETGDVSASASSETHITGGGAVETRTETIINGKSTVDEKHTVVPKGDTITISASSSASSGGKNSGTSTKAEAQAAVTTGTPQVENYVPEAEASRANLTVFGRLSHYIERLAARFNLFAWWR